MSEDIQRTEITMQYRGNTLALVLDEHRIPNPRGIGILCPGWFSTGYRMREWARVLGNQAGFSSTVVHFPGHGVTPGRTGVIDLDEQIAAVTTAVAHAQPSTPLPLLLAGASGGCTALVYASEHLAPDAIFGISPFIHVRAYRGLCGTSLAPKVALDLRTANPHGQSVQIDLRQSMESLCRIDLFNIPASLHERLSIAYGTLDEVIDPGQLHAFALTLGESRTHSFADDHSLTQNTTQVYELLLNSAQQARQQYGQRNDRLRKHA